MNGATVLILLCLLVVANGAPIIAADLLGRRLAWPIDGGRRFVDGRPLLGRSKTIRGVAAAVLGCAVAGFALGLPVHTGALFGLCSMAGDVMASFIKRRMRLAPGHSALGLDQSLEALLPSLVLRSRLSLDWIEIVVAVAAFFVLEILLSRLLYRLRVRKRPL